MKFFWSLKCLILFNIFAIFGEHACKTRYGANVLYFDSKHVDRCSDCVPLQFLPSFHTLQTNLVFFFKLLCPKFLFQNEAAFWLLPAHIFKWPYFHGSCSVVMVSCFDLYTLLNMFWSYFDDCVTWSCDLTLFVMSYYLIVFTVDCTLCWSVHSV